MVDVGSLNLGFIRTRAKSRAEVEIPDAWP